MAKVIYHHYGKIVNGAAAYYNYPLFAQSLAELEGKEFDLIIKEKYKKVSLDTHGYYRGGVIKEALKYEIFGGWDEDMLHDFFASEFLRQVKVFQLQKEDGIHQAPITSIRSTSSLSQGEMNEFVDKVIRWLANEGIVIHSPEQYYLDKYKTADGETNE
jgi:hypothetical protein